MSYLTDASSKWEKTREKGRSRFVWRSGVLGFGLTTAVLTVLLEWAWPSDRPVVPFLLMWPVTGYLWGQIMWWYFERVHQRALSQSATTDAG